MGSNPVAVTYSVGIFWLAKCFYKNIVSNQIHFQMLAMMLLMRCHEKIMVFDWRGSIQLFSVFDTLWIWFDHSVDVFCSFQSIRTFRIFLKLFYVFVLSFSVYLYFSHDIFCTNPCLTNICLIVVKLFIKTITHFIYVRNLEKKSCNSFL